MDGGMNKLGDFLRSRKQFKCCKWHRFFINDDWCKRCMKDLNNETRHFLYHYLILDIPREIRFFWKITLYCKLWGHISNPFIEGFCRTCGEEIKNR